MSMRPELGRVLVDAADGGERHLALEVPLLSEAL